MKLLPNFEDTFFPGQNIVMPMVTFTNLKGQLLILFLNAVNIKTEDCSCPLPCTASYYQYKLSSSELSNDFVKNELRKGKDDPKFQEAVARNK